MRYSEVIGGSVEDAEAKFSWLSEASFRDAIIDISGEVLVWENGVWLGGVWENGRWENGRWENGVWEDGLWKNGIWNGGIWEDGVWRDGVWESGVMWSNIRQRFVKVKQEDGVFKEVDER